MNRRTWKINDPKFQADQVCPNMAVYPWSGHRRFAYDLTLFVRPKRVVELGTHMGTSFFAFCQAVKDGRIRTHCVAVDTWKGDPHTGYYGAEVFTSVKGIRSEYYKKQRITLLRTLFSEALDKIEDESVDILHIDGYHTLQAVSEDYRTWLPKLRADGIVLFHDIAESSGYGSARHWRRVKGRHKHFEFTHSWGLGVLFPKGDAVYQAMLANNFEDKIRMYESWAELDLARIQVADLTRLSKDRYDAIKHQTKMIDERDTHIEDLTDRLALARDLAKERLEAIQQQSKMIDERNATISDLQQRLSCASDLAVARYNSIQQQSRMIAQRDAMIKSLNDELQERNALIEQMQEQIQDLASKARSLEGRIDKIE